jgi:replicative DNA helicase
MGNETIDPEIQVLGSVLLTGGKCLDDLTLTPQEFLSPKYGEVYGVMLKMWKDRNPVDVITISANPEYRKILGITPHIAHEWTAWVASPTSVGFYAEIIAEKHVRKELFLTATQIANESQTLDYSILTETARKRIDTALGVAKAPITFVYDELDKTIESLTADSVSSFRTPWIGLDQAIGGWRPGALYIIGARPGRGKTSIGIQSALELSKYGSVAFSSLEMRREEIHKRIISMTASIPMDSVMNNRMSERDWEKWALLRAKVQPKIAIDDRAEVTIQDIRTHARSVNRNTPLSGIIVDYLQLMTSRDNRPRHEIVSDFSRQLKIMARDLNVPVIGLSQLNRASEARLDKRPSLGDLRESGAIEQDADVVILLHLEDDGTMLLDVAKNRHGAQATVKLNWEGHYARAV